MKKSKIFENLSKIVQIFKIFSKKDRLLHVIIAHNKLLQ